MFIRLRVNAIYACLFLLFHTFAELNSMGESLPIMKKLD
ncbi:uncharacterized protein METZ01_LOCUS89710 [marine metagenome]|uniref:Uncharacterized protein n=1 Tax=marine metagenome TaxID=408172 RepID=A0A381V8Y5_9ZZZZ